MKKTIKSSRKSSFTKLLALSLGIGGAGLSSSSQAATDLWIGNTNANFNTLSNWTSSANPNGNTPTFGVAGSSGTTLNNDQTGATYVGLTFNNGASAFTINGNSFTLTGNITNSSANLQTINNNLTIANGNRTLAGGAGGLTLGGTITHTQTSGSVAGVVITGTVNSAGSFTEDGGSTVNGGYLSIGGAQTLNVTAGTFSVLGTTDAAKPLSSVGQNAAGTSNLNVSGGNLVIGANTGFSLANASSGTGVLTISSGTATINRGTLATTTNTTDTRLIMMGKDPSAANGNTGIINLNGGTLATDRQFVRDGAIGTGSANAGIANFVFGGGTLKALGTQTDWLQSATATSAGQNQGATGGTVNTGALALSSVTTTAVSTIDANSFSVAINSAISGAGGFTIIDSSVGGGGVVTFGGTKTYTGATTVNSGTFSLTGTIGSGTGTAVENKATFNESGTGVIANGSFTNTSGTATLAGVNTYIGATTVNAGKLVVSGSISGSSASTVAVGATLASGNNTSSAVGAVSLTSDATSGGTLAVGDTLGTSGSIGKLNVTGNLALGTASTVGKAHLAIEIGGTNAGTGYDQVSVTSGAVSLNDVNLDGTIFTYTANSGNATYNTGTNQLNLNGDKFFLIIGASSVGGTFANQQAADSNLTAYNTISFGGQQFAISYTANASTNNFTAGSGNDVALMAIPEPSTYAMLLGGLGTLVAFQRRRRLA